MGKRANGRVGGIPADLVPILSAIPRLTCWQRVPGGLDFLPVAEAVQELTAKGFPAERANAALSLCVAGQQLTPLHSLEPTAPVILQAERTFPLWLATLEEKRPERGRGGASCNSRMIDMLHTHPESHGWTVRQWAEELGVSISTVHGTKAWKQIRKLRVESMGALQAKLKRAK